MYYSLLIALTPPHRETSQRRPATLAAALVATATALAGCSWSGTSAAATIPVAVVSQRYTAAVDPANAALGAMLNQALAYKGGPTTVLDAATAPTATSLQTAAHQAGAIAAPEPLHRDIAAVVSALNTVADDLAAVRGAKGLDVQTAIARLVADAGREAAADAVVRLTITDLTTPTTAPPATLEAPTTTTTIPRHTSTTQPRTTTTVHSTTTKLTTTTSKP